MSHTQLGDPSAFLSDVLSDLRHLNRFETKAREAGDESAVLRWASEETDRSGRAEYLGAFRAWVIRNGASIDAALSQAQALRHDAKVRQALCQALQSAHADSQKVATAISPVLLTLSVTNQLPFPLTALVAAHLSIIIAGAGVSAFCGKSSDRQ
jgi:hypothetical protein